MNKKPLSVVIVAIVLLLVFGALQMSTLAQGNTLVGEGAGSTSPPLTLINMSESQSDLRPISEARSTHVSQALPAQVSVFYPTMGQSPLGTCWMGLRIDSTDNVYPINGLGFYKILPDGTLVDGVDDTNFFSSGSSSFWGELDESGGKLYTAAGNDVRSAPFVKGSTFSILISGLSGGNAITLGQGPLVGSLFATENLANRVSRVTLFPPGLSVFSSGTSFFSSPEAIASAPDGTLYVVNLGFSPTQLTKITPAGVPSTFLTGTVPQVNRAVIVDDAGNVYWSHANGINKYDTSGNLLGTLPGPPDKPTYGNPMGAAFDSSGNLYIVDNFDCKKIYKYTIGIPVTVRIKPETLNLASQGVFTAFIQPPEGYNVADIDVSTVVCEGAPAVRGMVSEKDNGTYIAKFNRQDLVNVTTGDAVTLTVTGKLYDGTPFEGSDTIRVIDE